MSVYIWGSRCRAVKDCEYVIHVASPFPYTEPANPSDVIEPAKEGTLSVLRACAEAGTVKRVVVTSSTAAIYSGRAGKYRLILLSYHLSACVVSPLPFYLSRSEI